MTYPIFPSSTFTCPRSNMKKRWDRATQATIFEATKLIMHYSYSFWEGDLGIKLGMERWIKYGKIFSWHDTVQCCLGGNPGCLTIFVKEINIFKPSGIVCFLEQENHAGWMGDVQQLPANRNSTQSPPFPR